MSDNFPRGSPPPIGTQIRQLREALGLTLSVVARMAGTSVPAMHRYESGWNRFELNTLRRIATALGAALEIRFIPSPRVQSLPVPHQRALVELLAPLFWDRELDETDLDQHRGWVIGRVLMYGTATQVKAVRSRFGDDEIRNALQRREIDSRTRNYWMLMLEDACTRRC